MLEADRFVVKQQAGFLKAKGYDLYDAEREERVGEVAEARGGLAGVLRWVLPKGWLPTTVEVRDREGAVVFKIRRGAFLFRGRVEVLNADDERIGRIQRKRFALAGGFRVIDADGKPFAEVKGNLFGSDYRILTPDGAELGRVAKKWGGMKELFTGAGTYLVDVCDDLAEQPVAKMLVLAAALAADILFKAEKKGG